MGYFYARLQLPEGVSVLTRDGQLRYNQKGRVDELILSHHGDSPELLLQTLESLVPSMQELVHEYRGVPKAARRALSMKG